MNDDSARGSTKCRFSIRLIVVFLSKLTQSVDRGRHISLKVLWGSVIVQEHRRNRSVFCAEKTSVWTRFWVKQIGRQATGWWTVNSHLLSVRRESIAGFRFCARKSDQLQRDVDRQTRVQTLSGFGWPWSENNKWTAHTMAQKCLLFHLEYPYIFSLLLFLLLVSEVEKIKCSCP